MQMADREAIIDFIEKNTLLVVDTYNNALLRYDNVNEIDNISWRRYSNIYYPNGKLKVVLESISTPSA